MEYAGSYALFNYRLEDPALGMEYSNLRLIRAFEHGLDQSSSEAGFVLVHVDMVQNSGLLVEGAVNTLSACGDGNRKAFNAGLEGVVQAMVKVNGVMDGKHIPSRPLTNGERRMKLTLSARYVEEKQTRRLQQLSYVYFRNHETVDVPARGCV